jgi:hypothetical protein
MAEIRVPKRQSFINRPVGVARTDAGEVQAAQQLANASRTLSNATFNTASQFMQAGMELQQDYEQRKFSEWAETVSMTNPDGSPGSHKMPKYLSGKTKDQVNGILQKRYAVDSSRRLDEHMVQARAKYANSVDEESLFAKDVSTFVEQTAQQIEKAGGLRSAQQFRDQATLSQSKHINNIRVLNSEKAENANAYKLEQQIQKKIGELQVKAGDAGELVTREDYLRLSAEIDELTQTSAISVRKQGELRDALRSSYALGILNNSGFLGLSREQRAILLSEISIGGTPTRSMEFVPEIAALMAPGGILSDQQTRNAVFSRLSSSDTNLSKEEVARREQQELASLFGSGKSGVKNQKATQFALEQQFNIAPNNPYEFLQAYQNNPEMADIITSSRAIPSVVKNTLDFFQENVESPQNIPLIIGMARIAKDSMLSVDGVPVGDLGLEAENLYFIESVLAIDETYPSDEDKFKAIRVLAGGVQEVNMVGRKLAAKDYITASDDYTGKSPVGLAKTALYKQDKYNPDFIERYGAIYANAVHGTSVAKANATMDNIYSTYYKEYSLSYVPDGGYAQQAYTPNQYYDGYQLIQFELHAASIIEKMNDASMGIEKFNLGRDTFLKADPTNDREYGRWTFVDSQGQPRMDSLGNFVTIDINAIEAKTVLQRRRRFAEEAEQREIARQDLALKEKPVRELGRALAGPM